MRGKGSQSGETQPEATASPTRLDHTHTPARPMAPGAQPLTCTSQARAVEEEAAIASWLVVTRFSSPSSFPETLGTKKAPVLRDSQKPATLPSGEEALPCKEPRKILQKRHFQLVHLRLERILVPWKLSSLASAVSVLILSSSGCRNDPSSEARLQALPARGLRGHTWASAVTVGCMKS